MEDPGDVSGGVVGGVTGVGLVSKEEIKDESQPEVDIVINNVVCSFSVRCHLNLKEIAMNGSNVEYRRENGMVTMKLRYVYYQLFYFYASFSYPTLKSLVDLVHLFH